MYHWKHFYLYNSRSKKKVVKKAVEVDFAAVKLEPWYSRPSLSWHYYKKTLEVDVMIFGCNLWLDIQFVSMKEVNKR